MTTPGVLCFFCGRAGAGKSTFARQMSADRKAILVCEDQWLVRLFDGARHELHYLVADVALCKQRVAERNLSRPAGVYWGDVSEAMLDTVNAYFQPPTAAEGFTVFERPA